MFRSSSKFPLFTYFAGKNFSRPLSINLIQPSENLSFVRSFLRVLVRRPLHSSLPSHLPSRSAFSIESRFMTISYPPSLTFLGDSRMQSREICVFPVYLLRGHVPCNRFSFLLRKDRESNAPSDSTILVEFFFFLFSFFTR